MKTLPCRRGFSLVELSIVLVVIGLLVGGVISVKSLIRAAEVTSIITESQIYRDAVKSFRDKYSTWPGDMRNATAMFGFTGGAGCTNRSGTSVTTPGTCDGNGNGNIEYNGAANQSNEAFQAWRQLALGGFIEGSYTGNAGSRTQGYWVGVGFVGIDHLYGVNSPQSRIPYVGWGASFVNNSSLLHPWMSVTDFTNWLTVGTSDGAFAEDAFLTPEEAWSIDTKIDDGLPGRGIAQSFLRWGNASIPASNCAVGGVVTGGYDVSRTAVVCAFFFKPIPLDL